MKLNMTMMITMNDVIGFIRKSMDKGYIIYLFESHNVESAHKDIEITKGFANRGLLRFKVLYDDHIVEISTHDHGYFKVNNISNKEIAEFDVLFEEYREKVGLKKFKTFFDESIKDINNLDDED